MRFETAMLVFRKDWTEMKRNWQVLMPILIVPLMFSVVLPLLTLFVPSISSMPGDTLSDVQAMLDNLPQQIRAELAQMSDMQVLIYVMSVYFFAPFFLIIPIMASSVIASDSFAGEKERKTIEALLATPISDSELMFGKMLVSFLPALAITVISFAVYAAVVDLVAFRYFGRLLLPNANWLLLIFGLSPAVSLASIGLTVIISAKVKGFREAQQISVLLLLPVLGLLFAQVSGALIFGPAVIGTLIAIFIVVDLIMFKIGVSIFRREEILA
ncbi:MAG: ABC transporter permease subunit, partial [Candidatus Thermoplasmatota archaeon]|nr:ABC transporter permease subunit [Candidatus Thermoplasmatota archaeon]